VDECKPLLSGRTPACPDLLKYSCGINANVRLSDAIRVVNMDGAEEDAAAEEEAPVKAPRARRFPPNRAVAALSETIIPAPAPAPAPPPAPPRVAGEGGGDALAAIIGGRQGLPLVHFSPPPETFLLLI